MAKEVDNVTAEATKNMPEPMQELVAKATKVEDLTEAAPEVKKTRTIDSEKKAMKKELTELKAKYETLQHVYEAKCSECLDMERNYALLLRKADAVAKAIKANVDVFNTNVGLIIEKGVM